MIKKYRVLFLGLSSNKEAFKLRMIRLGAPPETVDRMIDKAPVILKEGLSSKNSRLYADAVQKAGGIIEILEYESFEEPDDLFQVQNPEPSEESDSLSEVLNSESIEEPKDLSEVQDDEPLEDLENLSEVQNSESFAEPAKHPISIIPFKDFTMCPECGLKQQKNEVCIKCGFRLVNRLEPKNVAGH